MRIYIPTLFRNKTQITLNRLPEKLLGDVVMVLDKEDHISKADGTLQCVNQLICPKRGIGHVRQWIMDNHDVKKHGPNLLMLDDDLRFFVRRKDDPSKFLPAQDKDIIECIKTIENLMTYADDPYAHAGILAREGGNRVQSRLRENTRLLRALAYNVSIFRKEKIRFDRLPVMEDFDVALSLIEKGYKNVAVAQWCQDQTRSNAPGGCSTYRDLALQAAGAEGLKKLHPDFVALRRVKTLTAWNGAERLDVKIEWRKCYAASQK